MNKGISSFNGEDLTLADPSHTKLIEALASTLNVSTSVAMDIHYLQELEKRVIMAAQQNPSVESFDVYHETLEGQLAKLGV